MQVYSEKLTGDYEGDIALLDGILRTEENFDIIRRAMKIGSNRLMMYCIDGFVKADSMQKLMTHIFGLKNFGDGGAEAAKSFAEENLPSVEVDVTDSVDTLVLMIMSGCTVLLCDGFGKNAIVIDARTYPGREASEPENDKVMRGSRDGFVETLIFNTAMIRRRIRDTSLTVRYLNVGKRSRTDMALCFMEGKADSDYVRTLEKKLLELPVESLTLGHRSVAEALIPGGWYNPFPRVRETERPDAAAATLLEGGIVLLIDNSPEAMIFPTSIFDFLQETDDYYFPPLAGTYLRILRHLIFWMTVIITPLWYLLLMNEALLPQWLTFVIPKEPGALPILFQLYLTEFALDGLKLASLNTPNVLSNSLSVVGGLLLGDFAVNVGWLCPDVILYMAFVAIANFTQSNYELGYAFKYLRMLTLALTALFGLWGFIGGLLAGIILAAVTKTANGKRRYLYPLIPFNGKALLRLLFRLPKPDA